MLSALWEMPKELLVITKSWTWEHASAAAAADYWKAKETAKKNTGGGTLWWSLWLMLRCPKKMKTAQVFFSCRYYEDFFFNPGRRQFASGAVKFTPRFTPTFSKQANRSSNVNKARFLLFTWKLMFWKNNLGRIIFLLWWYKYHWWFCAFKNI